jgi:hypothetical protein
MAANAGLLGSWRFMLYEGTQGPNPSIELTKITFSDNFFESLDKQLKEDCTTWACLNSQ